MRRKAKMTEDKKGLIESKSIANIFKSTFTQSALNEQELNSWLRIQEHSIRSSLESKLKEALRVIHLLQIKHSSVDSELEESLRDNQLLQARVKEIQELLGARRTGIGLMRLSFLWSLVFVGCFIISVYSEFMIVQPFVCLLGFVCSSAFFSIGFLKSRKSHCE